MFLGQKVVGADIKGKFVIPSYQRGYRWGRWEVKRLLDDIRQNGNAKYCLQPIVVKVLDKETYELIDGQQRLTTLYILLTFLKREYKPKITIPFEIEYEIRKGSAVSRWMCSPVKKESYRSRMWVYPPSCYTGMPWQEVCSIFLGGRCRHSSLGKKPM